MNPLHWSVDTWQWIVIFGLAVDIMLLIIDRR
jgi:hypothetical protein